MNPGSPANKLNRLFHALEKMGYHIQTNHVDFFERHGDGIFASKNGIESITLFGDSNHPLSWFDRLLGGPCQNQANHVNNFFDYLCGTNVLWVGFFDSRLGSTNLRRPVFLDGKDQVYILAEPEGATMRFKSFHELVTNLSCCENGFLLLDEFYFDERDERRLDKLSELAECITEDSLLFRGLP